MTDSDRPSESHERHSGVKIGDVGGNIENSWFAGRDIVQQFIFGDTKEHDRRNKLNLLDKVRALWIKPLLEDSIHEELFIEVGRRFEPNAVSHPWDRVLITADNKVQKIPPDQSTLDLFHERGNGLLVLGDPGSGKTITLLEMARDAATLARRDRTCPIPVVFNLSWGKRKDNLAEWLIDELKGLYGVSKPLAREWIEHNDLLLLLDALDEVAASSQESCIESINDFRKEHGLAQIVVCSRWEDYKQLSGRLAVECAIRLCPLSPDQVDNYLTTAGPRLSAVRVLLQQDEGLRELARTPLMLSVMSLAYEARSPHPSGHVQGAIGNSSVEALFDAYVARMFKDRPSRRFCPEKVGAGLEFLANRMSIHNQSSFALETLQPSWLSSDRQRWFYSIGSRAMACVVISLCVCPFMWAFFDEAPFLQYLILALLVCAGAFSGVALGIADGRRFNREISGGDSTGKKRSPIAALGATLGLVFIACVGLVAIYVLIVVFLMDHGGGRAGAIELVLLFGSGGLSLFVVVPIVLILGMRRRWSCVIRDVQTAEFVSLSWKRVGLTTLLVVVLCGGGTFGFNSVMRGPQGVVWDIQNKIITPLDLPKKPFVGRYIMRSPQIRQVEFDKQGTKVAFVDDNGEVRVFSLAGRAIILEDKGPETQFKDILSTTISFSNDGQRLSVERGVVYYETEIFNTKTWERLAKVGDDRVIAKSPNLRRLVVRRENDKGVAQLLNLDDGRAITSFSVSSGRNDDVVKFNRTSNRFMVTVNDEKIELRDAEEGRLLGEVCKKSSSRLGCVFTLDGSQIIGFDNGVIRVWSAIDASFMFAMTYVQLKDTPGNLPRMSEGDAKLFIFELDGTARIWDMKNGALVSTLNSPAIASRDINNFDVNSVGTRVFDLQGTTFSLWNVQTGTIIPTEGAREVASATFGPDGKWIVLVDKQRLVYLMNAGSGRKIADLESEPIATPVGTRIITLSKMGKINLRDSLSGSLVSALYKGADADFEFLNSSNAGFSPDGSRIWLNCPDGRLRVYDASNGHLIALLRIPSTRAAEFANDDRFIVTVSAVESLYADWRPISVLWVLVGLLIALLAGRQKEVSKTKTRPNEGLLLTMKNAFIAGVVAGFFFLLICTTFLFLIDKDILQYLDRLASFSLAFTLLIAFSFGTIDLMNHYTLRLIVRATEELPPPLLEFLDYGSSCALLRRVGSHYIFIHRLLLEYFSQRFDHRNAKMPPAQGLGKHTN